MADKVVDVVYDADGVPTSFRVFMPGSNLDYRGLDAVYDPRFAKVIMDANTRSDGTVPIDLAHGMVAGADAREEYHEALGWGKLRCDKDGVWLDDLKWDPETRKKLIAKKLRFISPTFTLMDKDKKPAAPHNSKGKLYIHDLITVTLTNIPATEDAKPLIKLSVADEFIVFRSKCTPLKSKANGIVKRSTMATNKASKEELAVTREEDEDEDEGKGDEPVVREDEDEDTSSGDSDDSDKDSDDDDDGDMDPESADIDSMNESQVRKFAAFMVDEYMKAKSSMRKREEEEDEEDEEEKREIVNSLQRDALITYSQKKPLMQLTLRDLRAKERELRRKPEKKAARKEGKVNMQRSMPAEKREDKEFIVMGATDEEIEAYLRSIGSAVLQDKDKMEKLGLTKKSPGFVYGATLSPTKFERKSS